MRNTVYIRYKEGIPVTHPTVMKAGGLTQFSGC